MQIQDLCLFIFDVIVLLSSQNSWSHFIYLFRVFPSCFLFASPSKTHLELSLGTTPPAFLFPRVASGGKNSGQPAIALT